MASLTYKDVYRRDMDGMEAEVATVSWLNYIATYEPEFGHLKLKYHNNQLLISTTY